MGMTGRVADRLGLTAAGLAKSGLSVRHVQAWLDRVRDGELDPQESAATRRLVFRVWLFGLLLKALGSGWDVAWHFRWLRDDFAPPHDVNLIGDGVIIALALFHWYTRFAVDRLALRLMIFGVALFTLSAPADVVNHRINGLDITSWSVTHFGLYTGTGIAIAGAIRAWHLFGAGAPNRSFVLGALWFFFFENVLFPNQHQEYGIEEIRSWDRGDPYAEPSLLEFAAQQIGKPVDRDAVVQFSLPVPDWLYPVWIVGAGMLTLVIARRHLGLRWAASAIAGAYLVWRCVLWPVFTATGFPTSAVPFLLLLGAVAIDLAFLAKLPNVARAAVGAALVTVGVYAGGFAQSSVAVAPPIGYRSAPAAAAILFVCWLALLYLWPEGRQRHAAGGLLGGEQGGEQLLAPRQERRVAQRLPAHSPGQRPRDRDL